MPRRLVIFDTNTYIGLGSGGVRDLRRAERTVGVVGVASLWVLVEMMVHLADPDDPAFGRSWSGIRALRAHTEITDSRALIPFLGSPRDALGVELFRWEDPATKAIAALVGETVLEATAENNPGHPRFRSACKHAREFVEGQQSHFGRELSDVKDGIRRLAAEKGINVSPGALAAANRRFLREDGINYAAETLARELAGRAGKSITGTALQYPSRRVREVLPVAVHFFRNELERLVAGQGDPSKPHNSNSIWDLELACMASPGLDATDRLLQTGSPPLVVTNERRILRAADEAALGELVLDETAYRSWLGSFD